MRKTKVMAALLAAVMAISIPLTAGAARIPYLPDVTEEMSAPAYWCTDDRLLMDWDEIQALNALTIAADGTGMYDLKNQAGVMTGYNDTLFGPNAPLTREQMAAVLYRYGEIQGMDLSAGENADLSAFADARTISPWAEEAMAWAVGAGILEGSNNCLTPRGDATRAQCAVIFMRYGELEG